MVLPVQATRLFTVFRLDQLWKPETVRSNWPSFIFWTDRKTDRQRDQEALILLKLKGSL
jgi:hypothetical protein